MLRVVKCLKLILQIPVLCHNLDLFYEDTIVKASLLFVHILVLFLFVIQRDLRNFCEQLDGLNPGAAWLDQISQYLLDQFGLENISKRNPRKKCLQSL